MANDREQMRDLFNRLTAEGADNQFAVVDQQYLEAQEWQRFEEAMPDAEEYRDMVKMVALRNLLLFKEITYLKTVMELANSLEKLSVEAKRVVAKLSQSELIESRRIRRRTVTSSEISILSADITERIKQFVKENSEKEHEIRKRRREDLEPEKVEKACESVIARSRETLTKLQTHTLDSQRRFDTVENFWVSDEDVAQYFGECPALEGAFAIDRSLTVEQQRARIREKFNTLEKFRDDLDKTIGYGPGKSFRETDYVRECRALRADVDSINWSCLLKPLFNLNGKKLDSKFGETLSTIKELKIRQLPVSNPDAIKEMARIRPAESERRHKRCHSAASFCR